MSITRIIGGLLDIGVHLSGRQYELLKWRLSPAAQKYYTAKENKEFYKNLKKGKLRVVDAIRKEKQMRIRQMKQTLLSSIVIIFCLSISGCGNLPKDLEEPWDVNSLKTEERTFEIKEQIIKIEGEIKPIKFDSGWFVVSEDHIKTFNENQDDLLLALTKLQSANKKTNISYAVTGGLGLALLLILILRRRK